LPKRPPGEGDFGFSGRCIVLAVAVSVDGEEVMMSDDGEEDPCRFGSEDGLVFFQGSAAATGVASAHFGSGVDAGAGAVDAGAVGTDAVGTDAVGGAGGVPVGITGGVGTPCVTGLKPVAFVKASAICWL
jgi:hypothetical protein